jgi:NitT/TauT family transport system substrate-binding protein
MPNRTSLSFLRAVVLSLLCAVHFGLAVAAEPLHIAVSVPGPGAASYLPIELIPRIGADRAEGAQVEVRFTSGGGPCLADMLNNNSDFAVVGLPAAMSARLRDKRVVALAAVNDLPLYVLMVRWGLQGQVKRVADLKGRTLGVHTNTLASKTNSHQLLELMLKQAGISMDDVRVVPVGQRWASETAMLKQGDVDAVMGDEPHAMRMAAERIAFPLVHLGDPKVSAALPGGAFLRGALIGRADLLDKDGRKAEVMVRILRRTLQWLAEHTPEEIVVRSGFEDPAVNRHFLTVLRKYPRQYSKDGSFSTRQLRETEVFFHVSQGDDPAARALRVEDMVVDRWAGRKE